MSDFTNVAVPETTTATPTTTASAPAPSTLLGQAQATATSSIESAHAAVAPQLNAVSDKAAPHLQAAADAAAPYIAKAHEIIDPYVQKGTDLLAQAKASADKAISDKNFRATATDAKDKTVSATEGLAADASATTQAATSEGSASLDQAKTYLAGVASTVGAKAAELAHTLDDKTKTADHPGVVSQLSNLASAFLPTSIASHLPTTTSTTPAPVGSAIHEASASKADEEEIKQALRDLAGKGATSPTEGTVATPLV